MCCQSVTCQVAVTECLADAWGCAGKTPGQDGWARVSAGLGVCWVRVLGELGVGPGGGVVSEAPGAMRGPVPGRR